MQDENENKVEIPDDEKLKEDETKGLDDDEDDVKEKHQLTLCAKGN